MLSHVFIIESIDFTSLHLEGSFRLAYNGSMFAQEGLGILLTLNNLIDTSSESGLVFRPLSPHLEMNMYQAVKAQALYTGKR